MERILHSHQLPFFLCLFEGHHQRGEGHNPFSAKTESGGPAPEAWVVLCLSVNWPPRRVGRFSDTVMSMFFFVFLSNKLDDLQNLSVNRVLQPSLCTAPETPGTVIGEWRFLRPYENQSLPARALRFLGVALVVHGASSGDYSPCRSSLAGLPKAPLPQPGTPPPTVPVFILFREYIYIYKFNCIPPSARARSPLPPPARARSPPRVATAATQQFPLPTPQVPK